MLPNLNALVALETLDRIGSITKTADSLGLTHGAVSHKLKQLEGVLGFKLTLPNGRGVILSSQARQYVASIRPALDAIKAAEKTVSTATGNLTVNIAAGFAANWLAPRVAGFHKLFPDIKLSINTAKGYGDLGDGSDDIYVTFGYMRHLPDSAEQLFPVDFFPVCSPSLTQIAGESPDLNDSVHFPLLHLYTRNDWRAWLEKARFPTCLTDHGTLFDDMQIMQATAIGGYGLFLGDSLTTADALRQGSLVRPFSQKIQSDRAYYILPGKSGLSPAAEAFKNWVMSGLEE